MRFPEKLKIDLKKLEGPENKHVEEWKSKSFILHTNFFKLRITVSRFSCIFKWCNVRHFRLWTRIFRILSQTIFVLINCHKILEYFFIYGVNYEMSRYKIRTAIGISDLLPR